MRKLLISLIGLLSVVYSMAQDMKVVDFRLLENDLTANTRGTEKIDQNGERAALIKIVTPERGFTFDGGSLGIVASEEHTGEIWLYVPRRAQKLIVKHDAFGVLRDYYYPIPISGGRTYEMLIDIGTGRYVTITSEIARSKIVIDGEDCGPAPIYNKYLNYGRHIITATKDRYEGKEAVYVTTGDDQSARVVNIEQTDISNLFADVTVRVDNNADIYFEGQNMGTNIWKTQLREGSYTVVTRKADCDSVKTSFIVKAGQANEFHAAPPIPYTGFLSIFTRPQNTTAMLDGKSILTAGETVTLPVGTHSVDYTAKGYVAQRKEYEIYRNLTVADTVMMAEISYLRPNAFYFGGGVNVRTLGGYTATVGAVLGDNDFQISYTFGNSESDIAYWSNTNTGNLESRVAYKMNSAQIRYGYQIRLMRRLGLTPQVGFCYNSLSAVVKQGTTSYGDGASQQALTIGAKLTLVPMQHVYIFAMPEIGLGLKNDEIFKKISDAAGFSTTNLGVIAGVVVSF